MKIVIPAETRAGRSALRCRASFANSPNSASMWLFSPSAPAFADDAAYTEAGAQVFDEATLTDQIAGADVVASVRPLDYGRASRLRRGGVSISFLSPAQDTETIKALRDAGATSLSFDLLPRISRAQSMDALTSKRSSPDARGPGRGDRLPSFFPLFMTAAGTIQRQGAGTRRRRGRVASDRDSQAHRREVSAYDVRPASADGQVHGRHLHHLGSRSPRRLRRLRAGDDEDRAERQREALTPYISGADVVITTAAVPSRGLLLWRAMVKP